MVNDNLPSSPTAKKRVRFQHNVDHVSTNLESCKIASESLSTAIDNDKDEYLSRVVEIPDTPVTFDTINVQSHPLSVHSSLTHDSMLVSDNLVESISNDEATSTCINDEDGIDEDAVDRSLQDVKVSSEVLEIVMEEIDGNIEEHFSSDDETEVSISSSAPADVPITRSDAVDSTREKLLGIKEFGKVWTVYPSTPIPSSSITSIPLMHSVVIIPRISNSTNHKKKHLSRINSMRQDLQNNDEDKQWRTAFPEPDPTASDHSIFVDVAIQAMSVEEIDKDYPMMTHATYSKTKHQYQIDGGASLTAISESKARQLQCKFIQRKEFQIVVSVANGEMMRSQFYTPLKVTFTDA
jgi:hypothetical protein